MKNKSLYERNMELLEAVGDPHYSVKINGVLVGNTEILGEVSEIIMNELGTEEIRPVEWTPDKDDSSFDYSGKTVNVEVVEGDSSKSISKEEELELSILLSGDKELTQEELEELELKL